MVIWSCAPRPFVGALVRSRLIRALGGGTQMNAPALLRTAAGSATRVRRRTTRSSASGPGPLGDGTLRVRRGERNTAGDGEGANGVGGVVKRAREAGGVGGAKEDREVERRLLAWVELPPWQQTGSELIHTGYRKASGSVVDCLRSWTYLHNETVNIFSHLLGAVLFLSLPVYVFATSLPPRYAVATTADVVVITVYLVGVAVCFVLSATFHTLLSHSERLYLVGMRVDFAGILVLMWGATVPLVFASFPCRPALRAAYWAAASGLAALCTAVTLFPRFRGPALGPARAVLFASFGAGSFFLPLLHAARLHGMARLRRQVALEWILVTAGFNALAVVVYVLKFPERWFPRTYDRFGASHQLMHIFVLVAAVAYAVAVVKAFDFRYERGLVC